MNNENPYTLEISLNVLNHLGLNLYSNVPAVLSESVANAWDADASKVSIQVEGEEEKTITISDDGCGMSQDDLNNKFLTVGYERRKGINQDLTPKNRQVMGRKGIGKLSVFSIAESIQVFTRKRGGELLGMKLDLDGIKRAIDEGNCYYPEPIAQPSEIKSNGTTLVLSRLKKRVSSSIDKHLKKRIARRFDVIDDSFQVSINGTDISIEDRDYFHKLEFALVYGDDEKGKFNDRVEIHNRPNEILRVGKVRGWIGLAKESGSLKDESGNLNKISILSRGKVALEDILERLGETGLYAKFVIGEIRADFLDETEKEDIATSSRQDFVQTDPRFQELEKFIRGELKHLNKQRVRIKQKEGVKKASEIPAIKEWYESFKGDTKGSAKKLLGKINEIATDQEHRKTLLKHGVLAFEHLQHKQKLTQLQRLDVNSLEIAIQLFSELDDIEASWYYQITQGRLEVIQKLADHVNNNVLEKVIQEHIYNHLWLLDPSWDRATETPTMEKSVASQFDLISENLTDEQKRGRFDIKYKKTSGKHIIVELKRTQFKTSTGELIGQVDKYIKALRKQLKVNKANDESNPQIEAICLVGCELQDWEDQESRQESENALAAKHIRVVTYQKLVKDAEVSYQAYLDTRREKGRIEKLLDEIEASNGSSS